MSRLILTYKELELLLPHTKSIGAIENWCGLALEALEETTWLLKKTNEQLTELLNAVENKYPGETRFDTALRLIRKGQNKNDNIGKEENTRLCEENKQLRTTLKKIVGYEYRPLRSNRLTVDVEEILSIKRRAIVALREASSDGET